jgi:hypothetical protein
MPNQYIERAHLAVRRLPFSYPGFDRLHGFLDPGNHRSVSTEAGIGDGKPLERMDFDLRESPLAGFGCNCPVEHVSGVGI